jgi:hypothetical protein
LFPRDAVLMKRRRMGTVRRPPHHGAQSCNLIETR